MDFKKFYDKLDGYLDEALSAKTDVEGSINDMYVFLLEAEYEKLTEGFIYEKDAIVDLLLHYLVVGDLVKSKFICYVLNTHYKGTLDEVLSTLIADERYELCSILSKVSGTTECPSDK